MITGTIVILGSGIFFALATFYLNNKLQLGGVMASAVISIVTALFFKVLPEVFSVFLTTNIPIVAMGGSFIGMASFRIVSKYWIIGISGLFFSIIYLVTGSFFEGFGGSLGTTAAISLAAVYALDKLLPLKAWNTNP